MKLNLFSWTERRMRGEERWLTDMARCNFGDLLLPCDDADPKGDASSSKLCDFPWFLKIIKHNKKKIQLAMLLRILIICHENHH